MNIFPTRSSKLPFWGREGEWSMNCSVASLEKSATELFIAVLRVWKIQKSGSVAVVLWYFCYGESSMRPILDSVWGGLYFMLRIQHCSLSSRRKDIYEWFDADDLKFIFGTAAGSKHGKNRHNLLFGLGKIPMRYQPRFPKVLRNHVPIIEGYRRATRLGCYPSTWWVGLLAEPTFNWVRNSGAALRDAGV